MLSQFVVFIWQTYTILIYIRAADQHCNKDGKLLEAGKRVRYSIYEDLQIMTMKFL